METQAPDIDGCVLINDVPDGVVPAAGEICERRDNRRTRVRPGWKNINADNTDGTERIQIRRCRPPDYLALAIATCGVGYLPLIPGTFGSLVGVGIFLLLSRTTLRSRCCDCRGHIRRHLGRFPN